MFIGGEKLAKQKQKKKMRQKEEQEQENETVEVVTDLAPSTARPVVVVGEEKEEVDEGADFRETILRKARQAGLGAFLVYADGHEVSATEDVRNFRGMSEVVIRKYDEGA